MRLKCIIITFFLVLSLNASEKYTNDLINEESPYLQQHAHNPVNWMPWNEKVLNKAEKENKMIFLSIGYSTCHWCHVMEEESFENEEVSRILNKNYISIKIDREEMPHIDKYFQNIHNLVNERAGGWPLNIVLTPKGKAFFAATYIPIEKKYGRMGIKELLLDIQTSFETDTKRIYDISNNIERLLEKNRNTKTKKKDLDISLVNKFIKEINESFDHKNYGIGQRPKFPHASSSEALLDIYSVYKNEKALDLATKMLKAMANGGIYDQIEGGFYRYSVDEKWMIPHFEKMLYTNAELLSSYSKAYMITKDDFYKNIVDGIINFTKERFEKQNLLYSASDADSLVSDDEKEEGAYFVFSYDEVVDFLEKKNYSKNEIKEVIKYFNITFEGNFENGLNNLYLTADTSLSYIEKVKKDLKELRSSRTYPFVDYKILTSWNAMYISSLFEAGKIEKKNSVNAILLLDELIEKLYINDTLYHQRLINKEPKVIALFEDYSFLISTLLKAYDFSLENKYLDLATKLNNKAIEIFYKDDIWYMSNDKFKSHADIYDTAYKSSLSVMVENMLKIALLNDDLELQVLVEKTFSNHSYILSSRPSSSAWLLRNYLAYKKDYISLKGTKEMLLNKKLFDYPFLIKKVDTQDKYLACKIGICFAYSNDFKEIMKKIKENIEK